ncbi:MAG TPA: hypothetical protein VM432_00445 [Bdellovibrionales bacterium]|nr:hypothetical protein [Bdellovibrionales bacterium]
MVRTGWLFVFVAVALMMIAMAEGKTFYTCEGEFGFRFESATNHLSYLDQELTFSPAEMIGELPGHLVLTKQRDNSGVGHIIRFIPREKGTYVVTHTLMYDNDNLQDPPVQELTAVCFPRN